MTASLFPARWVLNRAFTLQMFDLPSVRCILVNGRFEVESRLGKGTRIFAVLPLLAEAKNPLAARENRTKAAAAAV